MAIHAISAIDAISQGSTWSQMLSVARFHQRSAEFLLKASTSHGGSNGTKSWKLKAAKRDAEAQIAKHKETAIHFTEIAMTMKNMFAETDDNTGAKK